MTNHNLTPELRAAVEKLTRPIIGMENRTPLEVRDILFDRIRGHFASLAATPTPPPLSEDLREAIRQALQCTPHIRIKGGNHGQPVHIIEYDCGDPWEILRAALARAQVKAS